MQQAFVDPQIREGLSLANDAVKKFTQTTVEATLDFLRLQSSGTASAKDLGAAWEKVQQEAAGLSQAQRNQATLATQANAQMAAGMKGVAAEAAIVTAVIGFLTKVVNDCTRAFMDQANQMRELQAVMGTTNLETAGWLKLVQDLGLGINGVERAFFAFNRQMEALIDAEA